MAVEVEVGQPLPRYDCFTSYAGTSAKLRKARTMRPKERAGNSATGKGQWRTFRSNKGVVQAAQAKAEKKTKKGG